MASPEWEKESDEVFYRPSRQTFFDLNDVSRLVGLAAQTDRNRARLCLHEHPISKVQPMIIIHPKGAYIRPHKHKSKDELFLVLDGVVTYIEFDEEGSEISRCRMGAYNSGDPFLHYVNRGIVHSIIIESEVLVFLEVTKGPFEKDDMAIAKWSPDPSDKEGIKKFLMRLMG